MFGQSGRRPEDENNFFAYFFFCYDSKFNLPPTLKVLSKPLLMVGLNMRKNMMEQPTMRYL